MDGHQLHQMKARWGVDRGHLYVLEEAIAGLSKKDGPWLRKPRQLLWIAAYNGFSEVFKLLLLLLLPSKTNLTCCLLHQGGYHVVELFVRSSAPSKSSS